MRYVILYCRGKYYLSNGFKASLIGENFNQQDALTYAETHKYRLRSMMTRSTQQEIDENHRPVQRIGVITID